MKVDVVLCSLLSLHSGKWFYGTNESSDIWRQCPKTSNDILFSRQKERYSCFNRPYRSAYYEPDDCTLLSLRDSAVMLEPAHPLPRKRKVYYVGDSLSMQMGISARCFVEQFPQLDIDVEYIKDMFLRDDFSCHEKCLSNSTYLHSHEGESNCAGCLDGIVHAYNTTDNIWHRHVSLNETLAIVLGAGAWYNAAKEARPRDIYNDTLHKVGNLARLYKEQYGIATFWFSLPPVPMQFLEPITFTPSWQIFKAYNIWAKSILPHYGVHYIDEEALLTERKTMNPNCTADGFHWW